MDGVAVNVKESPVQTGFEPEVIATDTVGTTDGRTVMVIPALVTVEGFVHPADDVTTQLITSPLVNVEGVYKVLMISFMPFFIH